MNPAADASAGIPESVETSTLPTLPAPGPRAIPPRFVSGERIAGRFRAVRLLGQGGTAHVYEADDLQLRSRVALKVLRPERARSERAAQRLRTEVLLARKVTHPNVCRIFDLFLHPSAAGEVPVVAMELLAGETLKDRIRRGPLSPAEALPLVRQMAEALDAAHRVGIAHLDFKSGNVMLVPSPDGLRAVVTDFGLARSTAGPEARRPMVGTPAYMAPEQVLGEETSPAADLYALGIVLYEMVTGALPFQGDSSPEIARKRLEGPPLRPSLRAPGLPPAWDTAILRCLERDPARRFAKAGDVASALAPRGAPSWKAWAKAAALCLMLAVPAGLAVTFQPNPPKPKPEAQRLYAEGRAALGSSDVRRAVEILRRVVEIEPRSALARSTLADAWMELGDERKAREESRRAVGLLEGRPRRQRLWVQAHYHRIHSQWNKAASEYSALWALYPEEIEHGLRLAEAQTGAGREEEALTTIEDLRIRFGSEDPQVDLAEARVASAFSDFRRQLGAAKKARKKGDERRLPLVVARAFQSEGAALLSLGHLEPAKEALRKARQAFGEAGSREGVAEAIFRIGSALNEQRQLGKARQHLEEARSMFRSLGDQAGEAWVLRELGKASSYEGNWEEAESILESSVTLFHKLGRQAEEAMARNDLALALRVREAFSEAEKQYRRSLDLARAANDRALEGLTLAHLGELVHYRDLEEGKSQLERAIFVCEEAQYKHCLAIAYRNLGDLLLATAELEEAEKNLIRARTLAVELGNPRILALVDLCRAAVDLEQGRPQEAERASTAHIPALEQEGLFKEKGMALTLEAQSLFAQAKRSEAHHALAQAMLLAKGDSRVLLRMVRIYLEAGQWEDARRVLDELPEKTDKMSEVEANIARKILDLESGNPVCSDLAALEGEARARGLILLAHRAASSRAKCEERYLPHR